MNSFKWYCVSLAALICIIGPLYRYSTTPKLITLPISRIQVIQHTEYLYNAYSPEFDEYFVIRSHSLLPIDTIVYFNDNAVVTTQPTQFTAHILSIYK